jgi:phenylpyruvate tautomerase PptA (4-oxalocrotonate tautomerase family)
MPHVTVRAPESQIASREEALIGGLTDAVASVYGSWARPLVIVRLVGVPAGRWGVGGKVDDAVAPEVSFGIRAGALSGADGAQVARRLVATVTDAVATALELADDLRGAIVVELVPQPDELVGVGGTLISESEG